MTNSADPDQLASSEANWSASTLFAKIGHVMFSKRRVMQNQKYKLRLKQLWQQNMIFLFPDNEKFNHVTWIRRKKNFMW